jgi:hypothetical protein
MYQARGIHYSLCQDSVMVPLVVVVVVVVVGIQPVASLETRLL